MENFSFFNPTRIIFGKGEIKRIGKEAQKTGKKALLVYGKNSLKDNGFYGKITESLKKSDIQWVEHQGVKANPTLTHTKEGIEKARNENCDMIIAAGGGSVIDESKAIAAGVFYGGDVWDFFIGKARIEKTLPLIAALTIPATGSEMNSGFVITNEDSKQKYGAGSPFSFPKVSILDIEATLSLPKEQSAYGAADAMAHLLEGYLTTKNYDAEMSDNYVFAVMKTVIKSTNRILKEPCDYNARASMMWAATMALNGLQSLGYGRIEFPNHAIEHSLSAIYDIPHGLGLAIIVPAYMRYYGKKHLKERLSKMGENVFGSSDKAEDIYEKTLRDMGLKTRLGEIGIKESEIDAIVENAMGLIKVWNMSISENEVRDILLLAR